MSSSSRNTQQVWLPHDILGFVPVRLSKLKSSTPTNKKKQEYTATPLEYSKKRSKLVVQKHIEPISITLSQEDIELLDPVKIETLRITCNNLSDLPSSDTSLALYHLQQRFDQGQFHTLAGNTIISINPAVRLPGSGYTTDTLWSTYEHYKTSPETYVSPHMYSVAGKMYHSICNPDGHSHYITLRGKNGAGKSDCVERMIEYLVNVSIDPNNSELGTRLSMASSILDAFTHVRSINNISSSRCCRRITMSFDQNHGTLKEWNINIPLLDTGGLTGYWNENEKNFHIFHYILNGMTDEELYNEMGITCRDFQEFSCLTHDTDTDTKESNEKKMSADEEEWNENNLQEYLKFLDAVNALKVEAEVVEMLRVAIAVMHLSVLEFSSVDKKKNKDSSSNITIKPPKTNNKSTVTTIAKLLGLDEKELESYLLCSNKEHPEHKTWSVGRAELHRNIFMNELYQRGVSSLVTVLNKCGKCIESNSNENTTQLRRRSITIFDPCVTTLSKGENDLHLQELQTYYMNEKLRQLRDSIVLAKELELYHVEDVATVSPFWSKDNEVNVQNLEKVLDILDSTKTKAGDKLDNTLLNSLIKASENVQNAERYAWKDILLEFWATNASKDTSTSLLKESTNILLQDQQDNKIFQQSFWFKTNGIIRNSFESIQEEQKNTVLRDICCIQANQMFRPITFSPIHILNQMNQLDIMSSTRIGRAGFACNMSCVNFYHWLHRLVPSLVSESLRTLTVNFDSMTKMFKTVAGCTAIYDLLREKKGTQNNYSINMKIGKTKVFLKHEHELGQLKGIRNSLWLHPAILIQSFLRMCIVRCQLKKQAEKWLKKKEHLDRLANINLMSSEDARGLQMRIDLEHEKELEKKRQEDAKRKITLLQKELDKIVLNEKNAKYEKHQLVSMKIRRKKIKRNAAIKIQSFGRRLICQSKVECALACLQILNAKNALQLKRAVNQGSRTLLRWRMGTSRLIKMLKKSREKLSRIKDEKNTLNHYLNDNKQWL